MDNVMIKLLRRAATLSGIYAAIFAAGWLLALLLTGCRGATEYVTVERIVEKHDTLKAIALLRDSIHLHDSVCVLQYLEGDTVVRTTTRWRTKYVERLRVDTLRETKIVRVLEPRPYPVYKTEYRDKPLSLWQRLLMWTGAASLLLLALYLATRIRQWKHS